MTALSLLFCIECVLIFGTQWIPSALAKTEHGFRVRLSEVREPYGVSTSCSRAIASDSSIARRPHLRVGNIR